MNIAYDLFKENGTGDKTWIETVIGSHNLKKRLMKLASVSPGTYMVYDPTEAKFVEPFAKSTSFSEEGSSPKAF